MTKDEYVKTVVVRGISVDIGVDDYGQSYFYEYDLDGEHYERSCGTYNPDYMEQICYELDPKGTFISWYGIDEWREHMKDLRETYIRRGLDTSKLDELEYNDYDIYDFDKLR